MSTPSSFDRVLAGLAAHDPAAEERVAREAYRRLVGLVRGRIGARFSAKVDADAVVNSALGSFFRRHAETPYELDGWEDLWGLLAEVARCKLSNHLRRFRVKVRDVAREVGGAAAAEHRSPAPPPDDAVVLHDLLEHLLAGYTETERAVIEMSLQGYAVGEIAAELGRADRTVLRVRKRFRARLERARAREAAP